MPQLQPNASIGGLGWALNLKIKSPKQNAERPIGAQTGQEPSAVWRACLQHITACANTRPRLREGESAIFETLLSAAGGSRVPTSNTARSLAREACGARPWGAGHPAAGGGCWLLPPSEAPCYQAPLAGLYAQNSPHTARREALAAHQNSPTQNPNRCSHRWVDQREPQSAHPKWSCRRSLSMAVALASSISTSTHPAACEQSNPPALETRGRREAVQVCEATEQVGWKSGRLRPIPTRCGRPFCARVADRVSSLPGQELHACLCSGPTSGPAPPTAARPLETSFSYGLDNQQEESEWCCCGESLHVRADYWS